MKALPQFDKSFGPAAASSATAQRKGGLKTIADNRPTMVAQQKLRGVMDNTMQCRVSGTKGSVISSFIIQRMQADNTTDNINAQYFFEEKELDYLLERCGYFDMGGACVAMTADWFSKIAKGKNYSNNPLVSQEEIYRLVDEQLVYKAKTSHKGSRPGMEAYFEGKGLSIEFGNDDDYKGHVNKTSGDIVGLEGVDIECEKMYALELEQAGGTGSSHIIGLYKKANGDIVVFDQNIGQITYENLEQISYKYSGIIQFSIKEYSEYMELSEEEKVKNIIPSLYKRWSVHKIGTQK